MLNSLQIQSVLRTAMIVKSLSVTLELQKEGLELGVKISEAA